MQNQLTVSSNHSCISAHHQFSRKCIVRLYIFSFSLQFFSCFWLRFTFTFFCLSLVVARLQILKFIWNSVSYRNTFFFSVIDMFRCFVSCCHFCIYYTKLLKILIIFIRAYYWYAKESIDRIMCKLLKFDIYDNFFMIRKMNSFTRICQNAYPFFKLYSYTKLYA